MGMPVKLEVFQKVRCDLLLHLIDGIGIRFLMICQSVEITNRYPIGISAGISEKKEESRIFGVNSLLWQLRFWI